MIVYHDSGSHSLFREYFIKSGVNCMPLWRNYPARFIYRKMRTHVPKAMVFNVPKPSQTDNKIIVFDTNVTPPYLYWLCNHYPDKRIILWYWNPVNGNNAFELFPRRVEIWSYSPSDCERYGFKYNSQFYFDCIAEQQAKNYGRGYTQPTVCFIGREKGRKEPIIKIKEMLEQNGIRTDFHFMKDGVPKNRFEEPLMAYTSVINMISNCDTLLDFTLRDETGLSLRPMEAMFFGKKLITNQRSIARYDFYRKENIYILGEEDRSIQEFLNTPGVEIEPEIRDFYLLSNWLKRFDQPEG